MAKPGPKSKPKIELSLFTDSGYCPVNSYLDNKTDSFYFRDLRTAVDYDKVKEIDSCEDFTDENITATERWKRYNGSKKFDLDYCKTARGRYNFKLMNDLYTVLWVIDEIVDSAETIVSPKKALLRCNLDNVNNESKETFLHNIATIGNFIPVPASNQFLLKGLEERFDKELKLIKAHFCILDNTDSHDYFVPESIYKWLELYKGNNANERWIKFVNCNYLNGSFVDGKYNVIDFDGTLDQLSNMIYSRSRVMIEEYRKRI